ncbi:uncharacterized protein LOC116351814 isoform X2 [Contarinia nasturtii]|uniref:uncharacterized protein LOC116351814 isoform X2 n=1 Tax=Contarinia nasturtii TaxID=265458 RepID=UPI0012D3F267|nr:uncharacterized protein LOC116351814 isoform X2 [Contarinia nasturtii]
MSLCQSSRYVLGVCVMSFLLNGTSSTEVTVQKQYKTATKTIEPGDWMPVGHADPLKNYPTYDYVPPTSGSVRYWSDKNENQFASNTSDKNEILLLGAAIKHSVQLQSNLLPVFEVKSNKRPNQPLVTNDQRSSPYYPPSKPSRVLTPPSIQDYNHYYTFASHFMNNDLSMSLSGDTRSTVI